MSSPMIKDRNCVRMPETQEEWVELVQKLEEGKIDDLPVSVMLRLAKTLNISNEELLKIYVEIIEAAD